MKGSPWRDLSEAAEFLRIKDRKTGGWNPRATLKFLDRKKVPLKRRGHALLVHVDQLQGILEDR